MGNCESQEENLPFTSECIISYLHVVVRALDFNKVLDKFKKKLMRKKRLFNVRQIILLLFIYG